MTSNDDGVEHIKNSFKRPNPETASTPPPDKDHGYKPETAGSEFDVILRLAALSSMEYDKCRKDEAKKLGVRIAILDSAVIANRSKEPISDSWPFGQVEPCFDAVDPAALYDEIVATIQTFIVLEDEQAVAAALWITMTWFIEVVDVACLAIINAPEASCGKTQLLKVFQRMTYRPLLASNASVSALFRGVEIWKPTILVDEADTFFRDNIELHGMFNAGHERGSSFLRSEAVGDSFEPRLFNVFSAKALAGVRLEKHLPLTTLSRGIMFNLRRKLPTESVTRLRHAATDKFTKIVEKLARFSLDYSDQVKQARLALPEALSDRDQDNWDALLAIAALAGGDWLDKATSAALKLSQNTSDSIITSNELLKDIQSIYEHGQIDKISTVDLITALCIDEEAPWATYNRGKPIAPRQLVKQLAAYGIKPTKFYISLLQVRGFQLIQFDDAFRRYVVPESPDLCVPSVLFDPEPSNDVGLSKADDKTQDTCYLSQEKMYKTANVSQDRYENHLSHPQAASSKETRHETDKKGSAPDIMFLSERF